MTHVEASTVRLRIAAILLLSLVLRVYYLLAAPVGIEFENGIQGSDDEKSHMNYVLALAEGSRIPVQTDSPKTPGAFDRNAFEYYQPPLYYWLAARAVEMSGAQLFALQVVWARAVSLAFAMAQIALSWPILRRAFPVRAHAESAFLVLACLGAHVKATTFVANDAAIFFFFTLGLLLVIWRGELGDRGTNARLDAALALVIALAWLTKSSATILVGFVLGAELLRARARGRWGSFVHAAIAVAAGTLAAAPWYARNLRIYGELFAISVSHGPKFDYPLTADYLVPRLLHLPYEMFFAWYVDDAGPLFDAITKLEYLYLAAALILLAIAAKRRTPPFSSAAGRLALGLLLVNAFAHTVYSFTYGYFGPRQLLGSASGWAMILALPAIALADRTRGRIPPAVFGALLVLPKHVGRLLHLITRS